MPQKRGLMKRPCRLYPTKILTMRASVPLLHALLLTKAGQPLFIRVLRDYLAIVDPLPNLNL